MTDLLLILGCFQNYNLPMKPIRKSPAGPAPTSAGCCPTAGGCLLIRGGKVHHEAETHMLWDEDVVEGLRPELKADPEYVAKVRAERAQWEAEYKAAEARRSSRTSSTTSSTWP